MQTKTKTCTKCAETKAVREFHKKKDGKFGVMSICKRCKSAQMAAYYEENKKEIVARSAAYYEANKDKINARKVVYQEENKEKVAARHAAYREANKKEIAARDAAYARANPDKRNAINARRRAAKLQATPVWADKRKIQAFFTESKRLEKETGIKHNVDHEVPLQNNLVCGLHNEFNLQVLTATENSRKHNKFTIDIE